MAYDYRQFVNSSQARGAGLEEQTRRPDRFSGLGNFILKDSLPDNFDLIRGGDARVEFNLLGIPVTDARGDCVDVVPALYPKPDAILEGDASRIYKVSTAVQARVVNFIGPKDQWKGGLSFLDGPPPGTVERQPSVFSLLVRSASQLLELPQYRRFLKFYHPNVRNGPRHDTRDDWLRSARSVYFLPIRCYTAPMYADADCNYARPREGILQLTSTAFRSLTAVMTHTRDEWVDKGYTHEQLASRQALIERFGYDACDPEGAPVMVLEMIRPQDGPRAAANRIITHPAEFGSYYNVALKGVPMIGNNDRNRWYDLRDLRPYGYRPVRTREGALRLAGESYVDPAEYLQYLSPEEIIDILLSTSSNPEWTEFLILCLQSTYLYPGIADKLETYRRRALAAQAALASQQPAPEVDGHAPPPPRNRYPDPRPYVGEANPDTLIWQEPPTPPPAAGDPFDRSNPPWPEEPAASVPFDRGAGPGLPYAPPAPPPPPSRRRPASPPPPEPAEVAASAGGYAGAPGVPSWEEEEPAAPVPFDRDAGPGLPYAPPAPPPPPSRRRSASPPPPEPAEVAAPAGGYDPTQPVTTNARGVDEALTRFSQAAARRGGQAAAAR